MMNTLLYITWNVDPEIFRIGSFGLRYYSIMFGIAFILGYTLMKRMYRREGLSEDLLGPFLIYLVLGTIIGARLGQTLFYEFDYYKDHIWEILLPFRKIQDGWKWVGFQGLASHGGALGILAAVWIYARKYKLPLLKVLDKLVIVVALGGFFIRIGNLFNSEIIGKPSSVPWAFIFTRVDPFPRHPSQLYEALAYLVIFFLLWKCYLNSLNRKTGFLFGLFLVLVFSARFLIEFTKEDQESFEKGWLINMGQILSIPFILTGAYILLFRSGGQRIKNQSDSG